MAVEEIVVVNEDLSDNQIQCTNHPYKNINPGAICSFCLQEKLGKLVSSSFPIAIFPSSSSSSSPSPSFRSNNHNHNPIQTHTQKNDHSSRRTRISFLITQQKKNKNNNTSVSGAGGFDFKRSKSTTTINYNADRENRKGFWSFLYHSKHRNNKTTMEDKPSKVSRSRSVGCGSRSFSGDFFDRISTGFGDCTLRRVESQREGKLKTTSGQDCIKERVKCGGIFSGFLMVSSSTETSDVNGKVPVNRSWGWPLASPIRAAYSSSSSGKRGGTTVNSNKINLNSTNSLMDVRG